MRAVIFAGPSLPPGAAPAVPGIAWHPPVRQGDVYKAALSGPEVIGIIDGYFEVTPTVWHKEILWAMAHGIHVYGAASIGALRAAELAQFGMKGIGPIYEQFRSGALADDDEVAVLHGPAELGYIQLTEAMVNVRATIGRASDAGMIDPGFAAALTDVAKTLFYKDRTYSRIIDRAAERGLPNETLRRFAEWLPAGQVDQKRRDALAMIEAVEKHLAAGVPPLAVSYDFVHTIYWEEARQRSERARKARRGIWRWFSGRS